MKKHIIRDSVEARRLIAQGLWFQRVKQPHANNVRDLLLWSKEIASGGDPLPPVGFVADVGHVALGEEWELRAAREPLQVPNLPMNLIRTYEDHVLGKIYADWTFGRASDALRRYAKERREQARGLAYFFTQFHQRAKYDYLEVSLGVLNALLETPPDELLTEGWESLRQDGPHELLLRLYESLIDAARRTPEVLDAADVFDLEKKYALEELGQRLAHRHVLRAAETLEATLPKHKIKPKAHRMEVPTRILDEDQYPVGGFTSVSNRGSVESLLHSQLAYMEPPGSESPDLFDTLFLMDELLYYSRDENQFLRRRRTFAICLCPDLVETRFKDSELPYQRGVMLMGLIHVVIERLRDWLGTDALNFKLINLAEGERKPGPEDEKDPQKLAALVAQWVTSGPLASELQIYRKLSTEAVALDQLRFERHACKNLPGLCVDWARKSMVHVLMVGVRPPLLEAKDTVVTRLAINGARPSLGVGIGELNLVEGEDAQDSWAHALQEILARWI